MAPRMEFENELRALHQEVLKMGAFIEQSIDMTIDAFENYDVKLAEEVIARDSIIDELEGCIESKCVNLTSKQQPVARDLRMITSILKIITDLERIADHCSDICEYVIKLSKVNHDKVFPDIKEMIIKVKSMITTTIDCYIHKDPEKAIITSQKDDEVDDLFEKIVVEIQEYMKESAEFVVSGTYLLFIIKYLERMADHATNICEWIAYTITGEHSRLN